MRPRILLISSVETDLCLNIARLPAPGEISRENGTREYKGGGKGTVAAVTLSRLGNDCLFCGKIGNDADGIRLRQLLSKYGIDNRFLSVCRDDATDFSVLIRENTEDAPRILHYPGASSKLLPDDVEEAYTAYPDSVLVHADIPGPVISEAVRLGTRKETRVFLDAIGTDLAAVASSASSGVPELLFTTGEQVTALTGISTSSVDSCLKASVRLASVMRANKFVILLKDRGAFLYDNRYYAIAPLTEPEPARSDFLYPVFTAAFLSEYLQCGKLSTSAKYANLVAELTADAGCSLQAIPNAETVRYAIS